MRRSIPFPLPDEKIIGDFLSATTEGALGAVRAFQRQERRTAIVPTWYDGVNRRKARRLFWTLFDAFVNHGYGVYSDYERALEAYDAIERVRDDLGPVCDEDDDPSFLYRSLLVSDDVFARAKRSGRFVLRYRPYMSWSRTLVGCLEVNGLAFSLYGKHCLLLCRKTYPPEMVVDVGALGRRARIPRCYGHAWGAEDEVIVQHDAQEVYTSRNMVIVENSPDRRRAAREQWVAAAEKSVAAHLNSRGTPGGAR